MKFLGKAKATKPDGLALGVCQSGVPLLLDRPSGDPQHVLISGTTGSGKSVFQRCWAGALAGLDDVALIGLDPKRTALGMWEPRFTVVAKSIDECTRTLVWLWAENERRLNIMEREGVDEWRAEYGGPFIVVFIDELVQVSSIDGGRLADHMTANKTAAFQVTPGIVQTAGKRSTPSRSKVLAEAMATARTNQRAQGLFLSTLARMCRSAGIQLIAATQYPLSDVVDPQVRANLDLRVMLRVPSNEMVKVCIGEGQHEDVTADSISRDERGGCWVAGLGMRPIRARGYSVSTELGRARALATAHLRWEPSDVFVGQELGQCATEEISTAEASVEPEPTPVPPAAVSQPARPVLLRSL